MARSKTVTFKVVGIGENYEADGGVYSRWRGNTIGKDSRTFHQGFKL